MANRIPTPVSIVSRDNRELPASTGTITKVEWTKEERTAIALKTFFIWFAAAFACIFVPIVHFFAVPILFISSFVLALTKLNETVRNEGGTGVCPKCHQEFPISGCKFEPKFTDTCKQCHEDVELQITLN